MCRWHCWSPKATPPTVDRLADRLGDQVIVDDAGLRCCTRATARRLYDAREGRREAQRQATRQARQQPNPLRERIRAQQEHQRQIDIDGDLAASALATITAGDHESRLAAAGRRMDDMLASGRNGVLRFHSFKHQIQED